MRGGCSANLCASPLSSAWCVSAHRQKKTTVERWKEIWAACDWKKARESAEAAALHLSVGGNCQSDSWYRSNLTPLRLAALVLVHIRTNGACTVHVYAGGQGLWMLLQSTWSASRGGWPLASTGTGVGNHLLLCAQVARKFWLTHTHTQLRYWRHQTFAWIKYQGHLRIRSCSSFCMQFKVQLHSSCMPLFIHLLCEWQRFIKRTQLLIRHTATMFP